MPTSTCSISKQLGVHIKRKSITVKPASMPTTGKISAGNLIYIRTEQGSVNFGTRNNKLLNILMHVITAYFVQILTDGKSLNTIQTSLSDIHVPHRNAVINTVLSFIKLMKSDKVGKISLACLDVALQIFPQVFTYHTSIIKKSYWMMKFQLKQLRLLYSYKTLNECRASQATSRDRSLMFKLVVVIIALTVHNGPSMPTITNLIHYAQHLNTLIT